MANGLKAVTKKIDESHPPREIRENTKARRAWLAAELERVNAMPNRSGKIVGQGSYQVVSVYETTHVEGRLRHRGVCQYCGAQQVVSGGALVLHGYARPGWGFVVNTCPGTSVAPLNTDKSRTEAWLAAELEALPSLKARAEELEAKATTAREAIGDDFWTAQYATPRMEDGFGRRVKNPTEEQKAAFAAKVAAWRAQYPEYAAWKDAADLASNARNHHQACLQKISHFRGLLASKVHGTPLVEEVVA